MFRDSIRQGLLVASAIHVGGLSYCSSPRRLSFPLAPTLSLGGQLLRCSPRHGSHRIKRIPKETLGTSGKTGFTGLTGFKRQVGCPVFQSCKIALIRSGEATQLARGTCLKAWPLLRKPWRPQVRTSESSSRLLDAPIREVSSHFPPKLATPFSIL
jgi:hypothetical protein